MLGKSRMVSILSTVETANKSIDLLFAAKLEYLGSLIMYDR